MVNLVLLWMVFYTAVWMINETVTAIGLQTSQSCIADQILTVMILGILVCNSTTRVWKSVQ